MGRRLLFLLILPYIPSFLFGIDINDALRYLEKNALNIEIITRVVDDKGSVVWNTEMSRITISGKSVKVKLSGVNILVITDITPYIMNDSTILLVSQGEVWVGSSDSDEMVHYSTIKSLPVNPGESVLFFPLGVVKTSETKIYNIELEIQVHLKNDNPGN